MLAGALAVMKQTESLHILENQLKINFTILHNFLIPLGVYFINILHMHFLYESALRSFL